MSNPRRGSTPLYHPAWGEAYVNLLHAYTNGRQYHDNIDTKKFESFLRDFLNDYLTVEKLVEDEPWPLVIGSGSRMLEKIACGFNMDVVSFKVFIELGCWGAKDGQ